MRLTMRSAHERRMLDAKKKKVKSSNYRKGGESYLFNYFRIRPDFDVQIAQKLDELKGKMDEDSRRKRAELGQILAVLPKKIPDRHGYSPVDGERDHFYLRFFRLLYIHINVGWILFGHPTNNGDFDPHSGVHWGTYQLKTLFYNLLYFDHGPNHPGAKKPAIRRRMLAHIRYMKAKRAREANAKK